MQSSSVAFLVQHGFDFQKSFAQGVHYLSRLEEEKAKLQEYLSVQQNQPQLGGSLTDAGDQEDFVKNVRSKINSWLLLEVSFISCCSNEIFLTDTIPEQKQVRKYWVGML